ncbi:hypothetical protein P3W85_03165 [Cupriavidus basilensis]|uniref:Uncharacterized protein n=1 Tax=Cupriavidus basilensis TaxID=68895 RepID=A0ABT6AH82_9BURK|nr:hypothetical protein [Cupriavidus basilensis]MDF3831959.1 hypothetical protein [Cupriavidus basilensis]
MQTREHAGSNRPALMTVQAAQDIEFLVKESEVLTGRPGRIFVVAGADRLRYRVHWHPVGLKVERLDDMGSTLSSQHLLPWEFLEHTLIEAAAAGQLYTPPIGRLG